MPTSTLTPPAPVPFTRNAERIASHFSRGVSVLPCTGEWGKCRPSDPLSHPLTSDGEQILVLAKWGDPLRKAVRVVMSSGAMHTTVGTYINLRHDQTGRRLGDYRIVGIVNVRPDDDHEFIGHCPNVRLNVAVFK